MIIKMIGVETNIASLIVAEFDIFEDHEVNCVVCCRQVSHAAFQD